MCILQGFPTALKSTTSFPFGLWFASPTTLYVADEGNGDNTYSPATGTYTTAAGQATAGLQKWVLSGGSWKLAYTLHGGLALGTPYTVPGYPAGDNAATGLPWAPATDGLRNITGQVNRDGSVTIWAITSTVSGAVTRARTRTSWCPSRPPGCDGAGRRRIVPHRQGGRLRPGPARRFRHPRHRDHLRPAVTPLLRGSVRARRSPSPGTHRPGRAATKLRPKSECHPLALPSGHANEN